MANHPAGEGQKAGRPHKSTTHEERFYHFRESSVVNGKKVKGATAFCRKDGDGWLVSAAFCSARDNWCKATGRTIARRHFFNGNILGGFTGNPSYETVHTIVFE